MRSKSSNSLSKWAQIAFKRNNDVSKEYKCVNLLVNVTSMRDLNRKFVTFTSKSNKLEVESSIYYENILLVYIVI
jgi:hypothetical protein